MENSNEKESCEANQPMEEESKASPEVSNQQPSESPVGEGESEQVVSNPDSKAYENSDINPKNNPSREGENDDNPYKVKTRGNTW